MGTNYYARENICPDCHRFAETHIGKSSMGWTFSFHATEEIRSYKDWLKVLGKQGVKIFNEYGEELIKAEFETIVLAKKGEKNNHTKQYPEGNFLDEEGNSMNPREFS